MHMENTGQGNAASNNTAGTQEIKNSTENKGQSTPSPITVDPSLIPEKFGGDIKKLVTSYAELEKKLSSKATETKPTETKTPNFANIEAKFWESGDLGAEERAALLEAGYRLTPVDRDASNSEESPGPSSQ